MKKRIVVTVLGAVLCAGIGLSAGAAVAATTGLFAPDGLLAESGEVTQPMPRPEYPTNANGETYGSAGLAPSAELEPDLMSVLATNGKEGFVRKTELDEANGTTAMQSFNSPEDAIRWQETEGAKDREVNVYAVDGMTVIGTFVIIGHETQEAMKPIE